MATATLKPIRVCEANTPEWLQARQKGIGASEAAAACGLSRWELPLEVWNRKVNGGETEENDAMWLGTQMEPIVAAMFTRKTGLPMKASPGLYQHPELPWMLASPDGFLEDGRGVELKTTTSRNGDLGEEGTDEVCTEWLLQGQQQIAVTGVPAVVFGVLIDGREFKQFEVERHSALIDKMIDREAELWRHVEARTPPPIDFEHTHAARAVADAFKTVTEGKVVNLDDECEFLARSFSEIGATVREGEKLRKEIGAKLLFAMQDAQKGLLPGGGSVSRISVKESYVDAYTRAAYSYIRANLPKS